MTDQLGILKIIPSIFPNATENLGDPSSLAAIFGSQIDGAVGLSAKNNTRLEDKLFDPMVQSRSALSKVKKHLLPTTGCVSKLLT